MMQHAITEAIKTQLQFFMGGASNAIGMIVALDILAAYVLLLPLRSRSGKSEAVVVLIIVAFAIKAILEMLKGG